jgi:hypothetical protein
MNADPGRREFVRHMTIGLPMLAGSAAMPAMARAAVPPIGSTLAVGLPDGRMDGLIRRMAALHNDMQHRLPRPEDATALASELRALVAYRRDSTRDAEISAAWRGLVARHGTARLAALQPDLTIMSTALARYRIDRDPLLVSVPSVALRAGAIDDIGRRGVNAFYNDVMVALDAVAVVFGAAASDCELLREAITLIETMASVMCLLSPFLPVLLPECFAASVVLAALQLLALLSGC